MMKAATVDRPTSLREMGRIEAEAITKAIQDNFDSLGSMLLQARDEKAYKALGYRSFEGYCKNEFGKSRSSAYRSIEDAQLRTQLEAEISKKYDKPVSLSISSACLKPLKELPDVNKRLEAIDYANKIAEEEGRKPEKKDLEIAAFKIGGHRPDDFKKAIESLGFTEGVAVEVVATSRRDKGIVKKVDKRGKIHVELHNGGVSSIAYGSNQLRILNDTEKPAIPANDNIVQKGDKVKIFARGMEGKTGEIYTWKMGKHAMVVVDGQSVPINIAYAELEVIKDDTKTIIVDVTSSSQTEAGKDRRTEIERLISDRDSLLIRLAEQQTRYLKVEINEIQPLRDKIQDLYSQLTISEKELRDTKEELKITLEYTKSGYFQQEILRLSTQLTEANAIIEELVKSNHTELLTDTTESPTDTAVKIINQREDHPQLAEATDSAMDYYYAEDNEAKVFYTKALSMSFSATVEELISGKKTQTRRMWNDEYVSHFIRYFEEKTAIPALNKGRYRGGHELGYIRLTQRPYQQLLSEMTAQDLLEEGGMIATTQEFINTFFQGQDKLVWVLHFEFQRLENTPKNPTPGDTAGDSTASASDSTAHAEFLAENTPKNPTPGDTAGDSTASASDSAAHTEFLAENTPKNLTPGDTAPEIESFSPALLTAISNREKEIREKIATKKYQEPQNPGKLTKKEAAAISADRLQKLEIQLQYLKDFREMRIGQFVKKRLYPETKGQIVKLEMSIGGMPLVWVAWQSLTEGLEPVVEHHSSKDITVET